MFYNNFGSVYSKLQQYDKVIDYFKKSFEISEEIGNKLGEIVF